MKNIFSWMFAAFVWLTAANAVVAQSPVLGAQSSFWSQTDLRGLSFDGLNSHIVRSAAHEGFELSGGEYVDLSNWYSPEFPNISASFETQLRPNLSMIWGGSLGESGTKYTLGPSGMIGFAYRRPVGKSAIISLEMLSVFGGALRERSCTANYGSLGGVQAVNCRLAATTLSPKQTLQYLWDEPPTATTTLRIAYSLQF